MSDQGHWSLTADAIGPPFGGASAEDCTVPTGARHHAPCPSVVDRATGDHAGEPGRAWIPPPRRRRRTHPKNVPNPASSGSPPNNPTNAGRPTSPTGGSPRHPHRDPELARRPLPLRALGHRPPPRHRPIVLDTFRKAMHTWHPGLHTDRQRHGVHHPTRRRQRRTQRIEEPTRRLHVTQINSTPTTPPPAAKSNASTKP